MEKFICEYVAGHVNGHSFWGIPAREIPDAYFGGRYGDRYSNPRHPANNQWLYWDLNKHQWRNGVNANIAEQNVGMFTYDPGDSRVIFSAVRDQYENEVSRR